MNGLINARCKLSSGAVQDLRDVGFVVIPGPVAPDRLAQFAEAYDFAVACAAADDVAIGRDTGILQGEERAKGFGSLPGCPRESVELKLH